MAEHLITCPGQYKQCCPLHHPAVLPDLFISPVWLSYIWMHRIAKDSQVIYGSMRKRQAGCEGEHDKKKAGHRHEVKCTRGGKCITCHCGRSCPAWTCFVARQLACTPCRCCTRCPQSSRPCPLPSCFHTHGTPPTDPSIAGHPLGPDLLPSLAHHTLGRSPCPCHLVPPASPLRAPCPAGPYRGRLLCHHPSCPAHPLPPIAGRACVHLRPHRHYRAGRRCGTQGRARSSPP
mmetsp:Transcript_29081/g.78334  ORF Transcript_29081/g.78334 Transcript_29081/m.78334 type:complete len:233 (-) Transcript_29081:2458-3156(-)